MLSDVDTGANGALPMHEKRKRKRQVTAENLKIICVEMQQWKTEYQELLLIN